MYLTLAHEHAVHIVPHAHAEFQVWKMRTVMFQFFPHQGLESPRVQLLAGGFRPVRHGTDQLVRLLQQQWFHRAMQPQAGVDELVGAAIGEQGKLSLQFVAFVAEDELQRIVFHLPDPQREQLPLGDVRIHGDEPVVEVRLLLATIAFEFQPGLFGVHRRNVQQHIERGTDTRQAMVYVER